MLLWLRLVFFISIWILLQLIDSHILNLMRVSIQNTRNACMGFCVCSCKWKLNRDKEEHVIEFMYITNRCYTLWFSVFIWLWNMPFIPWGCSRHTPSSPWQVLAVFWLTSSWRRSQGEISHCAQGQTVVFTVCCYLATQNLQTPHLPHFSVKALIILSLCRTMFPQHKHHKYAVLSTMDRVWHKLGLWAQTCKRTPAPTQLQDMKLIKGTHCCVSGAL